MRARLAVLGLVVAGCGAHAPQPAPVVVGNVASGSATAGEVAPVTVELRCETAECVDPPVSLLSANDDGIVVVEVTPPSVDRRFDGGQVPAIFSIQPFKCTPEDGSACSVAPQQITERSGIPHSARIRVTLTAARAHLMWALCNDVHCIIDGGTLTIAEAAPSGS